MRHLFALIFTFGLTAIYAAEAICEESLREQMASILDATIEHGSVSAAVALVDVNGERYFVARGVTDKESRSAIPRHARLRVASVGKLHTATIIHQLILQGRLSLDDSVSDLIKAHWTEGVANARQATVRQLLNHTSGIPDYYDDAWFHTVNTEQGNTPQRTLGYIHGRSASFEAGHGYGYSNSNYQYLALVAEAVSGKSFSELMGSLIHDGLGLQNTGYNEPFTDDDVLHGYGVPGDPEQDSYRLRENDGADGGVFTSADDLADTLQSLFSTEGALASIGQAMLSEEVDRGSGLSRALGPLRRRDPRGLDVVMHSGSIAGYATFAAYELNTGLTIVVHLTADRPDLATSAARQITELALTPQNR